MAKGPTVSATTTIPEEPPKETIITPLMQHVIDAHTPKSSSGRRQRTSSGGGGRTSTREKENQKKAQLPTIVEGNRADGKGGSSSRPDGKKVRERKTGKESTGEVSVHVESITFVLTTLLRTDAGLQLTCFPLMLMWTAVHGEKCMAKLNMHGRFRDMQACAHGFVQHFSMFSGGGAASKLQPESVATAAPKRGRGANTAAESDATACSSKREGRKDRDGGRVKGDKRKDDKVSDGQQGTGEGAKRITTHVGDLVAAQAVARTAAAVALSGGGPLPTVASGNAATSSGPKGGGSQSGGSAPKNGASSTQTGAAKGEVKRVRQRSGRGKRPSGSGTDKVDAQDLSNPRVRLFCNPTRSSLFSSAHTEMKCSAACSNLSYAPGS